jgi:hypothetical protein
VKQLRDASPHARLVDRQCRSSLLPFPSGLKQAVMAASTNRPPPSIYLTLPRINVCGEGAWGKRQGTERGKGRRERKARRSVSRLCNSEMRRILPEAPFLLSSLHASSPRCRDGGRLGEGGGDGSASVERGGVLAPPPHPQSRACGGRRSGRPPLHAPPQKTGAKAKQETKKCAPPWGGGGMSEGRRRAEEACTQRWE